MQILSKPTLAYALVALLIATMVAPLTVADSGRSTPDFVISSFTLDDAGSIVLDGSNIAEDATHVVRIQVQNIGLSAGQASLSLLLQGTSSSGDVVLDTADLGVINAGASSSVQLFSWAATLGDDQILKARVTSSLDAVTSNNELQKIIDVQQYQNASVPIVNIPQPTLGAPNVVWSQSVHAFSIDVRNDGVKNFSASYTLAFSEVGNPANTFSAASSTVPIVNPGSLYSGGATPQGIGMSFDATSRSGTWDVIGTMTASGVGWSKSVEFLSQVVVFSNYDFEITPAHDRSVEPGQTSTLTYLVKNVGLSSDDYTVSQSSVSGWVTSMTPNSQTPTVSPDVTSSVLIQVAVPADALRTDSDIVTLTVSSNSATLSKTVSTTVLASESYGVDVTMPTASTTLIPGVEATIQVNVENTGNAPTTFMLSSGVSTNPINWDVSVARSSTGILQPGEDVNIAVAVTPASIKNPLVSAEYNRAGDSMSVWVQAQSANGGLPDLGAAPVTIQPVIIVDPGLPTEHIEMTVEEVMLARQGVGLEEILDLDVEVRHNLVSQLSETVDATLSLGTPVFVSDSTGGFDEASRWAVGLTPTAFPGMNLGQTSSAVMTLQGPADDYPVSGTLTLPVTATPTLGSVHQGSSVLASAITQTLTLVVPPVLGAEGPDVLPFDVMVGEETEVPLSLNNTGNNMTSYSLVMMNTLPANWVASFSNSTLMPSTTLLSVPADVADYPSEDMVHMKNFSTYVTTDPDAPANSIEYLQIQVLDLASGAYVTQLDIPIRVGEKVNAELHPTSQKINLSVGDTITTSVVVSNVGNTPATFSLWLDDTNRGELTFQLETPNVIQIGAGYDETVRVRITPSSEALAATVYSATLWVANADSGLNLSADIIGNISEEHGIMVDTPLSLGVIPGTSQEVNFTLTNNGNLVEDIVLETMVAGNWTVTSAYMPLNLGVDEIYSDTFSVAVPPLGGDEDLLNGEIYPVTMRILNATTDEVLKVHTFDFIVNPLFMVEVDEWPATMEYHRGTTRTWDVMVTNTGNADVTVNLSYSLLQGGLTTPSTDWEISNSAPSTLLLKKGLPTQFTFAVKNTATQPALTLAANLIVKLQPANAEVQGSAEFYSNLEMDRFFEMSDSPVTPPQDYGEKEYFITYSHIPTGQIDAVAYEIELCQSTRLLNMASVGQNASDYEWSFSLRVGGEDTPLNLSQYCGSTSLGTDSRVTLPSRQPWVTSDPITLVIDTPNPPNILAGDGWDLTFRLYHPDENNGYTVYDEETFTYELAVYADPEVVTHGPDDDLFFEGQASTYSMQVKNDGTAQALGITPLLDCDGDVTVLSTPDNLAILGPRESHTFQWEIQPNTIDWWEASRAISCTASMEYLYVGENNQADNDALQLEITVQSWSPDLSIAFIACVVAALLSLIFVRLASQSEKWQLAGVYAGVISFGFAFHLFNASYWGPTVLILCGLWIWRMTWKSSEEFRLIHEDYQRARKGISTVYSDHFDALTDGRRQLTIILSIPVLGMLAIVLGLPAQLATDSDNLLMMVGYFLAIMAGVWYILRRSDRLYGNLYGRMTDAEIKAIRIERDLGDPARLLNDLADDGLDLTAILGERAPSSVSTSIAPVTPGEPNNITDEEFKFDDGGELDD